MFSSPTAQRRAELMNTVARREIKWLPPSDPLSLSLLFDRLNAATLHCRHLRLIPETAEEGVNFAGFANRLHARHTLQLPQLI